jgi:Flp pilus assembly protein TadG
MIEFAIVAPVLFLLLFGIVDAGKFFFEYNQVADAARAGARAGAVLPMRTTAERNRSHRQIRATVRANLNGGRLRARWITITEVGNPPTRRLRVEIANYPFRAATPLFTSRTTLPTVAAEFRQELQ